MPKRRNEEEIELLTKRLKQLEQDLHKTRRRRRDSSSSSRSSSCSQCSASRSSSVQPVNAYSECPNDRDTNAPARNDDAPLPVQAAARSSDVEPIAGPSHITPQSTNPASANVGAAEPDEIVIEDDDICQAELLDILGTDPTQTQEFGEDINKEVASRFEHIASLGLEKRARQELIEKFLIPANCKKIAAPQLNAEIKAAANEAVVKRDTAIEIRQKQIAAAITGIGRLLTSQLKSKEKDNNFAKQLMDVGRILCDIQHCESATRRKFALYSLKKDFRDQLTNTKIDKYLFGEDLADTLKTAKAVSKSGSDIKMDHQKPKQVTSKYPKNLNWKAGPSARNQQKGPTQKQQSAASSSRRHGNSSHRSSHRAKHSRRR